MGKGFDLNALKLNKGVSERFDRLAKEDNVTGRKYEFVFEWLVRKYRECGLRDDAVVLDECCRVGLPGTTLRMAGFRGKLVGCDISRVMLTKAFQRGPFDELFVQDVNEDLMMFDESVDLVVNVGSMELLDIEKVVKEAARVLKKGWQLCLLFSGKTERSQPITRAYSASGRRRQEESSRRLGSR